MVIVEYNQPIYRNENESFKRMDPLTAALANQVTKSKLNLIDTTGGMVNMCVAIQQMRMIERAEGREEGLEEGIKQGRTEILEMVRERLEQRKGTVPLTDEDIREILRI